MDPTAMKLAIQEASLPAILSYAGGGRPVGRKVGCAALSEHL